MNIGKVKLFVMACVSSTVLLVLGLIVFVPNAVAELLTATPIVVSITQSVPAQTELSGESESGEIITATVPFTVEVDLQIRLIGQDVDLTAAASMSGTETTTSSYSGSLSEELPEGMMYDNLSIPYSVVLQPGLTLEEWHTIDNGEDGLIHEAVITIPQQDTTYIHVAVDYYDENGEQITGIGLFTPVNPNPVTSRAAFDVECDWKRCGDVMEKLSYYTVEIEEN